MQASKELEGTRYGADALSISFAQIGNDTRAQEFLASIDVHPIVGDLVDCTSNYVRLDRQHVLTETGARLTSSLLLIRLTGT